MGKLIIHFNIPTAEGQLEPCITFDRWLPVGKENALVRSNGNLTARLWIDKSCVRSLHSLTDEHISNWVNICVNKVYIDIEVQNVPEDLITFIYDERDRLRGETHHGVKPGNSNYERLNNAYKDLGKKAFKLVAETYNRFIEFVRNNKGQYWLSKRSFDINRMLSLNVEFGAKVKSDSYNWVRWCPPFHYIVKVVFPDDNTFIKQEEWEQIKEFVNGNSRTDLVLELLSNAQSLLENGNRRSAIIEVVSALEVAANKFVKFPRVDNLFPDAKMQKQVSKYLKSFINPIRPSTMVNHLSLLLFPSDVLSSEVLDQCHKAIKRRNEIVHEGLPDIEESVARPLIYSVIKVCKILKKYTNKER